MVLSLCERRTSFFVPDIPLENSGDSYLFLTGFISSVSSFSSIDHLLCCYVQFFVLFHLTFHLLNNPSANVFVFGDFNVHHEDWLTYFGRTERLGELCYNFFYLKWLTFLLESLTDSQRPALLDLSISSDDSICFAMIFSLLENSDQVVVPVSIDIPINISLHSL